ncbi:MAG: helix-turn-helix transcriptional regulator [Bacteroidales bacterium]|nr:helix-turn-helix transcriptional regulator [Bacteroidales bacterium]
MNSGDPPASKLPRYCMHIPLRMAWIFLFFLTLQSCISARDSIRISDNEPFWYVYMSFDGYHRDYDNCEPDFFREIQKQDLRQELVGIPFNLYFSETDWAIGCRIKKSATIQEPLIMAYYKNTYVAKSMYTSYDENIPLYLEVVSNYIYQKNYYWDGPLIIRKPSGENPDQGCELVVPLTKDYYRLFIKPYGIARIVIAFLCLLFTIFLLTYKKGRILSNRILGVFMFTYVLLNCNAFLWIYNIYPHWPHFYNFAISLNFLLGPLLLFYTLSVIHEKFRLRKIYFLHLLPFLVVAVVYCMKYQIYDTESKLMLLNNGFRQSQFFAVTYKTENIQFISYLLVSIIYAFCYQFNAKHARLKTEKLLVSTLKFLLVGILILIVFEIIRNEVPVQARYHFAIKGIGILLYLVMISTLLIRCLRYPEIFSYTGKNGNGQKYLKSPLTKEHKMHYLKRMESYMNTGKPFLSSTINLPDFAKEISIPSRYISQVLNEELGMSFYDLINTYRIEEAKNLLSDPEYGDSSIIDIAYDCGFNSKSVFNAAFKKYTGTTPSEFRLGRQLFMNYRSKCS